MGDFNITVDTIDRIPPREDNIGATMALTSLLLSLQLKDGWRMSEPNQRDYSYPQRAATSKSRIDRIYVTDNILKSSQSWSIKATAVPTDHKLVLAKISTAQAPYVGKGRWSIPLHLMNDINFQREAKIMGNRALTKAKRYTDNGDRDAHNNPQLVLSEYKKNIVTLARNIMKKKAPKLDAAIKKLTTDINRIQSLPSYTEDPLLLTEADVLLDRIIQLERKRYQHIREATTARYALNAEAISKYWSSINKEKKPRDIIYSLKVPGTEDMITRSDRMAQLARDYHDKLQEHDDLQDEDMARSEHIRLATEKLESQLDNYEADALRASISMDDVTDALRKAKPGKASGPDGIPYEFWKSMHDNNESSDNEEASFDGANLLLLAYRDIETYGVDPKSGFADGWMCPIYKKHDRRDISNYRPITVLNSDYKLYTKVLASHLATVVKTIIHPNQAGFIPGRRITDQTQTCRTMVDYAEATENNGVIIALDQEKAYDKIKHDYLWAVLERAGVPRKFIDRIKSLYENATTVVIINGESSTPFRVVRGHARSAALASAASPYLEWQNA
ncbi:hypothetical protein EVJ58_g7641 [Rhodofomes roseus]|uniref:Reverse transcriptase domain-containing protein n=1 Tax=Rhodofomes roseus TaxID=34475 RepID=A0A4Y9Y6K0_9APHY|nr:hypothetical protein EVJ58_g7641 [Rhodofomes roseus]